jgi:hypothetical protein
MMAKFKQLNPPEEALEELVPGLPSRAFCIYVQTRDGSGVQVSDFHSSLPSPIRCRIDHPTKSPSGGHEGRMCIEVNVL